MTTGPLGQGIANAFGMAVAEAYLNARFGDGVVDHHTYAFVGDGCLQEGIGQEMISLAGHLRLGKLILLWDDNRITDDGSTGLSISEDVAARFRVADWHVVEVDGHDLEAVSAALDCRQGRPAAVADRLPHGHRARHRAPAGPARRPQRASCSRGRGAGARAALGWPHAAVRGARRRAGTPGATPADAANRERAAGRPRARRAAPRRRSAPSSNASSPASCPRAGATLLLDYKRERARARAAARAGS